MANGRVKPKGLLGTLIYERMAALRKPDNSQYEPEDMAPLVGVATAKTVRDYITGRSRPKSADGWLNLAKGLDVPVTSLLVLAVGGDTSRISAPEQAIARQVVDEALARSRGVTDDSDRRVMGAAPRHPKATKKRRPA